LADSRDAACSHDRECGILGRSSIPIAIVWVCGALAWVCGALASADAASINLPVSARAHSRLVPTNDSQAIRNEEMAVARELRTRVEQGDAAAMNGLGMMYALGRGVAKNYGTALELFRRAALQGQVPGMVNVGLLYDRHTNAARAERLASLLVEDIGQRAGPPRSRSTESASN